MSTSVSVAQTVKQPRARLRLGICWWDDSPKRTTAAKIERAAKRFTKLRGFAPTIAYCHVASCDGSTHPTITIKPVRGVARHTFYLFVRGAA